MTKPKYAICLFDCLSNDKPISSFERQCAKELSPRRAYEYKNSRACARQFLSLIHCIPPLDIPLYSPPSKPPILPKDFGYLSISHCSSALLLGWSQFPIGVDIEKKDRRISSEKFLNRFFADSEIISCKNKHSEELREHVLDLWVIKESAIKFQKGNISFDLNKWIFDEKSLIATHQSCGLKVRIHRSDFINWKISIAFDLRISNTFPIICYSQNT